ncbi:MAG: hypothetical protein AMXMBFR4_05240 [Candidatus Hydrogenedentota bacterium]
MQEGRELKRIDERSQWDGGTYHKLPRPIECGAAVVKHDVPLCTYELDPSVLNASPLHIRIAVPPSFEKQIARGSMKRCVDGGLCTC